MTQQQILPDQIAGGIPEGGGGGGTGGFVITAHIDGTLGPVVGDQRFYNPAGVDLEITAYTVGVSDPPVGQAAIFDANIDGTTIFTDQGNRVTVADGGHFDQAINMDVTLWPAGSYLTFDVDQAGSTSPGSLATLTLTAVIP